MSRRWHIDTDTGKVGECNPVKTGVCGLKKQGNEETRHYSSEYEARTAYEAIGKQEFNATATMSKSKQKLPRYENEDEREFWEKMRTDIGTIVFNGKEFGLQPDDGISSSVYCTSCNKPVENNSQYFNKEESQEVKCSQCSWSLKNVFSTGALLSREAMKFLDDKVVKEATWYHTTQNLDWANFVQSGDASFIHMGTEQAARDRTETLRRDTGKPTYIAEIRIKDDAEISKQMSYEDPYQGDTPRLQSNPNEYGDIEFNGVTRYLNEMEDPGSISLICNPKAIEVVSIKKLDADGNMHEAELTPNPVATVVLDPSSSSYHATEFSNVFNRGQFDEDRYRSTAKAFLTQVSEDEKTSLDDYVMSGYEEVNGYLYGRPEDMLGTVQSAKAHIRNLDSALKNAPKAPPALWRSMSGFEHAKRFNSKNHQVGDVIDFPGYISTSETADALMHIPSDVGHYQYYVPEEDQKREPTSIGVDRLAPTEEYLHGMARNVIFKISVKSAAPVSVLRQTLAEQEWLIPRGKQFRIVGISDNIDISELSHVGSDTRSRVIEIEEV